MLQENPMLERSMEETSSDSYSSSDSPPSDSSEESHATEQFDTAITDFTSLESERWEKTSGNAQDSEDDTDYSFQEPDLPTLRQHLLEQVRLLPLSERDLSLIVLLIDAINEDGYLEISLEELAALIPPEQEVDLLELQTALKLVQHLDPLGVGARNLAECLEIQLMAESEDTPFLEFALTLVKQHLALLASRDFARLKKVLHCDDIALRSVQDLITRLNPKPGAGFAYIEADHFIQPEVVVKKARGVWGASLNNDAVPKLRINRVYADILKRNRDSSSQYLNTQMQEAKWFIKNIEQRFATILRVSQAIVDRQRNFFEHGEIAMRPLVLREIAEELGMHESTISRVTTRKYMLTPRGVFELKYFFCSHVATESGGACSATAIRALIKQMIASENTLKPLSDNQIADILGDQGIVVARRTIAKYRESLQIPAASQRKSI